MLTWNWLETSLTLMQVLTTLTQASSAKSLKSGERTL
jgi:hypothetical protein